jgi:hypothetical protein
VDLDSTGSSELRIFVVDLSEDGLINDFQWIMDGLLDLDRFGFFWIWISFVADTKV